MIHAPLSPSPYRHWQDRARQLLKPLAALMEDGRAGRPLAGPARDHDAQADRVESFARPLCLAAHYLQSEPEPDSSAFRERIAVWFRRGLVIGTNPQHPQYWGPDASYHQHHVEMGLLSIALQIAPEQLWYPLTADEKAQVAGWLATARGSGIVNNNHLFMSVHILEFLGKQGHGHRTDRTVITAHLNQLETMHRGGGWFEDGINQAFDHYNAYAFHFYGLWWARLHGSADPARADRWRAWARLFVRDYQHAFAASGEHPAFGRSMMYRFNAIAVFGLAVAEACTDLPPGRLRRLMTRNLDYFLDRPIQQEQGCLSFGFTDRFEALAEPYSCAGSPYWCAKGFSALLIPPTHALWTCPEEPLPAETGDFVHVIAPAGLLLRGVGGEVEIVNAGSMVSNTQLRYGAWKWSKTAYRTGVGFTLAAGAPATDWSLDNALTLRLDDGRVFGRHSTVAIEMTEDHVGYSYALGGKIAQVNTGVETFIFWRGPWLLQVHHVDVRNPAGTLTIGGYALPLTDRRATRDERAAETRFLAGWVSDGRGTALQALHGTLQPGWDERLDETSPRRHVMAPFHVAPLLRTPDRIQGRVTLAVLAWAGTDRASGTPWRIIDRGPGRWELEHSQHGAWVIEHWSLP